MSEAGRAPHNPLFVQRTADRLQLSYAQIAAQTTDQRDELAAGIRGVINQAAQNASTVSVNLGIAGLKSGRSAAEHAGWPAGFRRMIVRSGHGPPATVDSGRSPSRYR
jgi:hypothetical protein